MGSRQDSCLGEPLLATLSSTLSTSPTLTGRTLMVGRLEREWLTWWRWILSPSQPSLPPPLRACRRVNDFSLTTRILEITKVKCGDKEAEFWPYIMQELKPTMDELGIPSLEEMGYHQPELALPNPYEIH